MHTSTRQGFTLIELLIVVVIIGILAAVAIPKATSAKQRASRSSGMADMRNLATAQEGFFADSNRYGTVADTGASMGKINFVPSPGNTNLIMTASTTGWSAVLTIPGNQKCGIYHGSATIPTGMPATTPAGVSVCW